MTVGIKMGKVTSSDCYILGAATGYSLDQVLPFIVSLKRTGYRGRLCLFVWDLDQTTIQLLQKLGAEIYPCQTRKLDKSYTVTGGRFFVFNDFLKTIAGKDELVMLTDVRDVFFQENPFEKFSDEGVCFFLEDGQYVADHCNLNSEWIIKAFHENMLQKLIGKPISCVGVTIGRIDEIKSYLNSMTNELMELGQDFFGSDQAIHNKMLYFNDKSYRCKLYDNENKFVKHLGLVSSKNIILSDDKKVLNSNGEVVAILHQYDRHDVLMKYVKGSC